MFAAALLILAAVAFLLVPRETSASGYLAGNVKTSSGAAVPYTRVTYGAVAGCGPVAGHAWTQANGNWSSALIPNGTYSVGSGVSPCVNKAYLCTSGNAPTINNNTVSGINFIKVLYTITASSSAGGSMTVTYGNDGPGDSPTVAASGAMPAPCNTDLHFTIIPDGSHNIVNVTVDGTSVGPVSSYTLTSVSANHTITASFTTITYTITASADAHSSISPGTVSVPYGANQTFNFGAGSCYYVTNVVVDGSSVGAPPNYTFYNITSSHSISVAASDDIPSAPGTPAASPSGWTNVNTFSFSWGGASPQSCVADYQFRIDGGAAVEAGNTLAISGVPAPGPGSHTFEVRALNGLGHVGAWSGTTAFYYTLPEIAFRPNPNGFKYGNPPYPLCCYPALPRDPTWDMFVTYFGHDNAYLPNGKKDSRAVTYFDQHYKVSARSGYCLGFSSSAIINYMQLVQPSSGAFAMPPVAGLYASPITWPLWPWDDMTLADPVEYYQATQVSNNVLAAMKSGRSASPSAVYQTILTSFLTQQPVVLVIRRLQSRKPKEVEHALLPLSAYRSGDVVSVGVYDCDDPGNNNRSPLQINLATNTWSYATVGWGTWSGNATSQTLGTVAVSEILKPGVENWKAPGTLPTAVKRGGGLKRVQDVGDLIVLSADAGVDICDDAGNCYSTDSLGAMNVSVLVPPGTGTVDSSSYGFVVPVGSGYHIIRGDASTDTAGVAVMGDSTLFAASAGSESLDVHVGTDGSTASVRKAGAGKLQLQWTRYTSNEQRSIAWTVSGAESLVVVPDPLGATLELPTSATPVTYDLGVQLNGDSTQSQLVSHLTLLPGQKHVLEAPSWDRLDSSAVVVGVMNGGDSTVYHLIAIRPKLTVVEGTQDSAYTTVYVELPAEYAGATLNSNSITVADTLLPIGGVVITDIDSNNLPEYAARFDRVQFRNVVFANATSPTLKGSALSQVDTVLFSNAVPRDFFLTSVPQQPRPLRAAIQSRSRPSDPVQQLSLDLPQAGRWRLDLMDVQGRRVGVLLDRETQAGAFDLSWSPAGLGKSIPAGVYFYRLTGMRWHLSAKIVILH